MRDETQRVKSPNRLVKSQVYDILEKVYAAMDEKGYNPINQIVGYIISGDPTYITSHKNARNLIIKLERDEILEEIVWYYLSDTSVMKNGKQYK